MGILKNYGGAGSHHGGAGRITPNKPFPALLKDFPKLMTNMSVPALLKDCPDKQVILIVVIFIVVDRLSKAAAHFMDHSNSLCFWKKCS